MVTSLPLLGLIIHIPPRCEADAPVTLTFTLSLETPDCVSVPVFENARVGNVSMVPQIIAVSEIFNNRGNAIVAIQLKQGPVRSNEFANLVARSVTITGASTIEKNAFEEAM